MSSLYCFFLCFNYYYYFIIIIISSSSSSSSSSRSSRSSSSIIIIITMYNVSKCLSTKCFRRYCNKVLIFPNWLRFLKPDLRKYNIHFLHCIARCLNHSRIERFPHPPPPTPSLPPPPPPPPPKKKKKKKKKILD